MNKGTIKFFSAHKGFGFITADEGGKDIFLPATALGEVKPQHLIAGQRVEFNAVPDAKGPKVSEIRLLGKPAPAPIAAAPAIIVYCDPSSETAEDVLLAIRQAGMSLQVVDYLTAPLSPDLLRRLSLSLGEADQSLVRRFDPLFVALQLDDRFIGDQDFWTGIIQHPALINGPILVSSGKARICKSAREVKAFLSGDIKEEPKKAKTLTPRLMALMRGEQVAPAKSSGKAEKTGEKAQLEPDIAAKRSVSPKTKPAQKIPAAEATVKKKATASKEAKTAKGAPVKSKASPKAKSAAGIKGRQKGR
ncbi:MAG: cold shock domain-containing protein [Alphaproteobacteria bacterium]|nr:cold shock domain-containing protein [Alphaproteobacteria bacterium]